MKDSQGLYEVGGKCTSSQVTVIYTPGWNAGAENSWFVWEEEQAAAWPWWVKPSDSLYGLGPIETLDSLAEWGFEGQVWHWGTVGFCISLYPWREQHSKLSGSLLAAGGTGSWAVLQRTKKLFNFRSGSTDGSQIIKYITWVETRDGEKFWDDLFEAALSQGFFSQGPEASKGLNFRPCDCGADGRQSEWEAGTAASPPATAHTRGDPFPYSIAIFI